MVLLIFVPSSSVEKIFECNIINAIIQISENLFFVLLVNSIIINFNKERSVFMDKKEKVKAFKELHGLLLFYAENRDQPVEQGFDFFKEVEDLCKKLDLDYETFKQEFNFGTFKA